MRNMQYIQRTLGLTGSMLVHAAVFKLIQESDNPACVR